MVPAPSCGTRPSREMSGLFVLVFCIITQPRQQAAKVPRVIRCPNFFANSILAKLQAPARTLRGDDPSVI